MSDITTRLRDPWEQGAINGRAMFAEAADEIDALRGAVRSLAGWVRELDPRPSLDPCEYLTDADEMAAVRRSFAQLSSDVDGEAGDNDRTETPGSSDQNGSNDNPHESDGTPPEACTYCGDVWPCAGSQNASTGDSR